MLLALLCVHFVGLVGARQDRLAQVASWWRDARQQRALMEDIVRWAEGRGELDEILAMGPSQALETRAMMSLV